MPVSVSSATQDMEDMPDEHHIGISEDQRVKDPCLRRTASLKLGMSDNNAEFNEETSFKVTDILNYSYRQKHLTHISIMKFEILTELYL